MRGGEPDTARSAAWFVKWWREEGCALSAATPFVDFPIATSESPEPHQESPMSPSDAPPDRNSSSINRGGWGFDFEWELNHNDFGEMQKLGSDAVIQKHMELVMDGHAQREEEDLKEGGGISTTQQKKKVKEEKRLKREKRVKALLAARRAGGGR